MTRFAWFLLGFVTVVATIPKQAPNCNDCYATTAYEIIRYHYPKTNVTVNGLMQETHQGCVGGNPQKILQKYFSGTKIKRGGLFKLMKVIKKHGPVIIDYSDKHLVTAWKATVNGVLVHDTRDATKKILSHANHPLNFRYILIPQK